MDHDVIVRMKLFVFQQIKHSILCRCGNLQKKIAFWRLWKYAYAPQNVELPFDCVSGTRTIFHQMRVELFFAAHSLSLRIEADPNGASRYTRSNCPAVAFGQIDDEIVFFSSDF